MIRASRLAALAVVVTCFVTPVAAEKVLQIPMRTGGPNSLDPVIGSTAYDNRACSQIFETLLQYKYLVRPPALEPLLLTKMPEVSADGLQWEFELREDARFHDDPCFAQGKGRSIRSDDVFFSFKRIADPKHNYKSWWLVEDTIVGFDEYKQQQAEAVKGGAAFDYDAPVEGFERIDDRHFRIRLRKPVVRFSWTLAMFQFSIVPREAVERYGDSFGRHPVGTGPFVLARESDWITGSRLTLHRNPDYRAAQYPSEHMPEDEASGLHLPAGTALPIVDRVEFTMFVEDQPMWLKFQAGEIGYTQVPAENFREAYLKRKQKLKKAMEERGIVSHAVPLLDFIFRGFNMLDETVGGYTAEKRALRHAIALAVDLEEFNDAFYNGINIVYDGPIPPGLAGYPENGVSPTAERGPNVERAKALLAEAGYPEGRGLAPIEYYTSTGGNSKEQSELFRRQLGKIGVELNIHHVDFATLMEYIDNNKAQMFSFAWGSDYPDAENNLALFFWPNKAPGSNHFNYRSEEYDALYRKILVMAPSPARTALLVKMREMVIADQPYIGSMARTRFYVVNPWLKNFKPSEDFYNWIKYLDVDDALRPGAASN